MTVGDFLDFVEGYKLRTKENFMLSDHANFILGQYVMSAVGSMLSSKVKYPKKPFTQKLDNSKQGVVNLSDRRVAKALFGKKK